MEGQLVVNLKEDGCNTNVVLQSLEKRNGELINWEDMDSVISHSETRNIEVLSEIWKGSILETGYQRCTFNWAAANFRYKILLSMLWNAHANPITAYEKRSVRIDDSPLPARSLNQSNLNVKMLSAKKFWLFVRQEKKETGDLAVF